MFGEIRNGRCAEPLPWIRRSGAGNVLCCSDRWRSSSRARWLSDAPHNATSLSARFPAKQLPVILVRWSDRTINTSRRLSVLASVLPVVSRGRSIAQGICPASIQDPHRQSSRASPTRAQAAIDIPALCAASPLALHMVTTPPDQDPDPASRGRRGDLYLKRQSIDTITPAGKALPTDGLVR